MFIHALVFSFNYVCLIIFRVYDPIYSSLGVTIVKKTILVFLASRANCLVTVTDNK